MSAPASHDPLVVNTKDGVTWMRRAVTSDGRGLYAVTDACKCPPYLMATLAELAEHGIAGSADVLPVPVNPGPVVRPLALAEAQLDALVAAGDRVVNDSVHQDLCACDAWPEKCLSTGHYFMGAWDVGGLETALPAVLGLWESMRGGELERLRARVAELEAQRERRRLRLIALQNDALSMRGSLSPNGEDRKVPFPLGEALTPAVDWLIARVAELEALLPADALTRTFAPTQAFREDEPAEEQPLTVYRAEYESMVFGLYTTPEAAREHCEAYERRDQPTASFDWIEDEEDGVAELVATVDGEEKPTGYAVTALEVASAYDEEADE